MNPKTKQMALDSAAMKSTCLDRWKTDRFDGKIVYLLFPISFWIEHITISSNFCELRIYWGYPEYRGETYFLTPRMIRENKWIKDIITNAQKYALTR